MNNLISDIIVDAEFKNFEVVTVGDVDLCSLVPPLIVSTGVGNVIGYSVQTTDPKNYRIVFLNDTIANFDILIEERTAQSVDSINTTDFSKSFTRIFPQICFTFPTELNIDFKNGLYISVEIPECISFTILPLMITTITMSDTITSSKSIFYDSVANEFVFNRPIGNTSENFFIRLVPAPVLSNVYNVITNNNPNYTKAIESINYTTLSSNLPITLSNSGFTFNNISTYTSNLICLHRRLSCIIKLVPMSSVCDFTFTLNNENSLFEIDSEGKLTRISDSIALDSIYSLNITIEDSFGQTITVIVRVSFSDLYLCKDFCRKRCINIAFVPCLPEGNCVKFILQNNNVDKLFTIGQMISHTIDYIIQSTIMISYNNTYEDPTALLDILYEGTALEFGLYYQNRIGSSNSNVLCKLDILVDNLFPFFKKYIDSVIRNCDLKCLTKRTPFGDVFIRRI